MRRIAAAAGFLVFIALICMGCATGKPLLIADLDEIGWDHTDSLQCYLSSKLTLTKLPGESPVLSFGRDGSALIREPGGRIVLPASLEGRIVASHRRDQFLYVAFEEGSATLPFARDKNGRFSLMITVDQGGVEFVEYEGVRYEPGYTAKPYLNVVITRSQRDLRREMQGSQVQAASNTEAAIHRASETIIPGLPENSIIVVLDISADPKENDTARFIREELQARLIGAGTFKVVDRASLDLIRTEQNFQSSGEVSDESAVSIGSLLGAHIVITGSLSGTGSTRRLNIKALDVKTGEIVANAREPL